ncbi:MAG: DUF4339 domain-containing protein [Isosphaeraceae bacterium]
MTEPSYYVRDRGRVTGPYSFAALQQLVKRSSISRITRVSTDPADPMSWVAADSIPDLFRGRRRGDPVPDRDPNPIEEPAHWHYVSNGLDTAGPVTASSLKALFQSGQAPADTLVWRDGFDSWQSAATIPELAVGGTAASSSASGPSATQDPTIGSGQGGALLATLAVGILLITAALAGLLVTGVIDPQGLTSVQAPEDPQGLEGQ